MIDTQRFCVAQFDTNIKRLKLLHFHICWLAMLVGFQWQDLKAEKQVCLVRDSLVNVCCLEIEGAKCLCTLAVCDNSQQ